LLSLNGSLWVGDNQPLDPVRAIFRIVAYRDFPAGLSRGKIFPQGIFNDEIETVSSGNKARISVATVCEALISRRIV
jgi:hypothetical protein